MQAVLLEEFQEPLTVQEVERPEPEPDGAVAEVTLWYRRSDCLLAGGLGLVGYRPDPPHVLGHEPTGRIVSVGEDVETSRRTIPSSRRFRPSLRSRTGGKT